MPNSFTRDKVSRQSPQQRKVNGGATARSWLQRLEARRGLGLYLLHGSVHGIKANLDGQIPCHRVAGDGGKGPRHGGGLVSTQGWKAALRLQVAGCVPGRH